MASEHPEREKADFYTHWIDETVRFHDLDAYNHVNNNVIGVYFETARMHWFESMAPKAWLTNAHFVLGKNTIYFLNELHYPNRVRIGGRLLRLGNTSITSCNAIFKGDTCIATCETLSVWINSATRRPEPISGSMRTELERFAKN
jgi:acyl-CoA thioester hydrolase